MSFDQFTREEDNIKTADVVDEFPEESNETKCNKPVFNTITKEETINNQESGISLEYLKMGSSSSSMVVKEEEEPNKQNDLSLRVEVYRPAPESKAIKELPKFELLAPLTHQVIVEEPQVQILPPTMHVAVIEEPKVELLPPNTYVAVVEEPKIGILKTSDGDEIIMVSDEELSNKINREIYESADEVDENNNTDDVPILQVIDSCCHTRRTLKHSNSQETQTSKNRLSSRHRSRVASAPPPMGVMVSAPSNSDSTEVTQKLKVSTQPQNTFKQRQLELHRHRIAVEQKRLELLELKLARERDEMLRERILFEKELDLKVAKLRKFTEDRIDL